MSLTERQREIAEMVRAGKANTEIAKATGVSVGTVKAHLLGIFLKLGIADRRVIGAALNREVKP